VGVFTGRALFFAYLRFAPICGGLDRSPHFPAKINGADDSFSLLLFLLSDFGAEVLLSFFLGRNLRLSPTNEDE